MKSRHLGALVILLAASARAHAVPNQPFFEAAKAGDVAALTSELAAGAAVDARSPEGYTALIYAAYHEHLDAVNFLLTKGADPCAEDGKGNTALMGTLFKGYDDLSGVLLSKCDVNHRNREGQTALMYASLFGREQIAKQLLAKGADKNLRDASGRTALGLAKGQYNQAMVALLKLTKVIRR